MTVDPNIEKIILEFHKNKKIIGACCIAPMLIAKTLGKNKVRITLGKSGDKWPYAGSIEAAKSLGAICEEKGVEEVCVDKDNLVVTAPAFMYEGTFYEIFKSVDNLVKGLIDL